MLVPIAFRRTSFSARSLPVPRAGAGVEHRPRTKLICGDENGKIRHRRPRHRNHCINDISVQGAEPIYFMDYIGIANCAVRSTNSAGRIAEACETAHCAVLAAKRRNACMYGTIRPVGSSPACGKVRSTGEQSAPPRRHRMVEWLAYHASAGAPILFYQCGTNVHTVSRSCRERRQPLCSACSAITRLIARRWPATSPSTASPISPAIYDNLTCFS